jgi:hypothetical protein
MSAKSSPLIATFRAHWHRSNVVSVLVESVVIQHLGVHMGTWQGRQTMTCDLILTFTKKVSLPMNGTLDRLILCISGSTRKCGIDDGERWGFLSGTIRGGAMRGEEIWVGGNTTGQSKEEKFTEGGKKQNKTDEVFHFNECYIKIFPFQRGEITSQCPREIDARGIVETDPHSARVPVVHHLMKVSLWTLAPALICR